MFLTVECLGSQIALVYKHVICDQLSTVYCLSHEIPGLGFSGDNWDFELMAAVFIQLQSVCLCVYAPQSLVQHVLSHHSEDSICFAGETLLHNCDILDSLIIFMTVFSLLLLF